MQTPTCYPQHDPVRGVELQHGERLVPLPVLQRDPVVIHPRCSVSQEVTRSPWPTLHRDGLHVTTERRSRVSGLAGVSCTLLQDKHRLSAEGLSPAFPRGRVTRGGGAVADKIPAPGHCSLSLYTTLAILTSRSTQNYFR